MDSTFSAFVQRNLVLELVFPPKVGTFGTVVEIFWLTFEKFSPEIVIEVIFGLLLKVEKLSRTPLSICPEKFKLVFQHFAYHRKIAAENGVLIN